MGFFDLNNERHRSLADAYDKGDYSNFTQEELSTCYGGYCESAPKEEVEQVQQEYFERMPQVQKVSLFSGLLDAVRGQGMDPRQAGINTTDPNRASPTDLGNLFNFAMNSGLLNGILGGQRQPGGLGGMFGGGQSQQAAQGGLGGLGGLSGILGGLVGGGQQQPQAPAYNQQPGNNQPGGGQQSGGLSGGLQGLLSNPMAQAAISGLVAFAANRAINGMMNRGQQSSSQPQPQPNYTQNLPNQGRLMSSNQGDSGIILEPGGGSALPGFENPRQ